MDLYSVLEQVVDLLLQRGRVSYRALKRQFELDDDFLEDLKKELLAPVYDWFTEGFDTQDLMDAKAL